ncbi:hypothetical protein [Aromatoleum diolicum]|uniref:Transposase n=1 Tax=Aromatoleum diolicum TaxID=75796 RepID=A0ABX1QER9_9RHOO|nr:hypothetical protein [Aromatoleum diolicum]NMG76928.1 hypothetical protein [Aromatoleum diolicum]
MPNWYSLEGRLHSRRQHCRSRRRSGELANALRGEANRAHTTTKTKRNAKQTKVEALVATDRDLMKALMKQALQEVLEGEKAEFLGSILRVEAATARGATAADW